MSIITELEASYDIVIDAYEVVAEYEFSLKGDNAPAFRAKILRDGQGQYMPSISHYVQASGCGTPHYPSFDVFPTLEEALKAALWHGLMNYRPEDAGAIWEHNPSF